MNPGGIMPFQPCHDISGLVGDVAPPLLRCDGCDGGENCAAAGFDIIWPNSEAMWFIVAVLYGWSMQSTQLHDGPQLHTWSPLGVVTLPFPLVCVWVWLCAEIGLNFITGKSGGGWNCCRGVKGADALDSHLTWPLVGVTVPESSPPPPQHEEEAGGGGAEVGAATGSCGVSEMLCFVPSEQHDPAVGAAGVCTGAGGGAQHELGAAGRPSKSTGSVVT